MRRRDFITVIGGAAAAWPLVARAQQSAMPGIGFLRSTSAADSVHLVEQFRHGLKQAGYVEGQNVTIHYAWAENQLDRLPAMVAELLRRPVTVIVGNTPPALAAKAATTTVPIVFATGGDPINDGLVASLNRPGGNVTGVSFSAANLGAKQLGLLRELRPGVAGIAALVDPKWPLTERQVSDVRNAAAAVGQPVEVFYVSSDHDIEAAFTTFVQRRIGGLLGGSGGFMLSRREKIAELAVRYRIPAIYVLREYVEAGGLMSYSPSFADAYRQAGVYAGRILKGEKPGDLPVVLPTKFELVVNVKAAKAIGLEIPDKVLALADEVIE
jgi:putative tryptophan/tyrosine transport system substrate-binding protein